MWSTQGEIKMQEIEELKLKQLPELQKQFEALFGTKTDSTNDTFLRRKIAYLLQERKFGGLSEAAKARITELIIKYDPVNNKSLRPQVTTAGRVIKALPSMRDKRLPIPGTIIRKTYKRKVLEVRVMEKGFEYNNKHFRTLSAIAKEVTGCHWNGFNFFNI
jgi:hypothetical protein